MALTEFIKNIGISAAIIHAIIGTLVPLLMVCMLTAYFGREGDRSWKKGLEVFPFAIFAGAAFTIPYLLVAILLGPEFPSLLGSIIGLAIVIFAASRGFLMPENAWTFPAQKDWLSEWIGSEKPGSETATSNLSLFKAWLPYILVVFSLVLTRVNFLPFGDWLDAWVFQWNNILGTSLSFSQAPLSLPGLFPFIPVALLSIPFFKIKRGKVKRAMKNTFSQLIPVLFVLIFAVAMVQVMVQSGHNDLGNSSMVMAMAKFTAVVTGSFWPMIAGIVGALGAFVSGSNTVSDMLFAAFQYDTASQLGISKTVILGLQAVGGAVGNMICVNNVVAASSTVGIIGREGVLIRRNLIPAAIYIVFAGFLGMVAIYGLNLNLI
jgi:lactate permease